LWNYTERGKTDVLGEGTDTVPPCPSQMSHWLPSGRMFLLVFIRSSRSILRQYISVSNSSTRHCVPYPAKHFKEKARRRVGIETWLRDERQRSQQRQRIFLFCKSRLLSNEKEGYFLWFKTARACSFHSARLRTHEGIIPLSHTHSQHVPPSSTGTALPSILTT